MIELLQKYLSESEELKLDMTSGFVLLMIESSVHGLNTAYFKDDKFYAVKKSERKDALKAIRARQPEDFEWDIDSYAVYHDASGNDDQVAVIHVTSRKTHELAGSKLSYIAVASTENGTMDILAKNPHLEHIKDEYEEGKKVYAVYVKLNR